LSVAATLIERNLVRANELIVNFKTVAADQVSEQRRKFDLKGVLGEVIASLAPTLKRHTHKIDLQVPEGIKMDSLPGPLGQVVINLINNAYLHAFEGRGDGVVTITGAVEGEMVRLQVRDNGAGIAPEDLARLFQPFFSTKIGRGGTGLGMAIVQDLVTKSLGGAISVQSELGQGSCFEIVLPIVLAGQPNSVPPKTVLS
jgi:signal transduction histidine kinase